GRRSRGRRGGRRVGGRRLGLLLRARRARRVRGARRRSRRGTGAGLARASAVVPVEAGALEDDAGRGEDLPEASAARRALGKRVVAELRHGFVVLAAGGARVLVRRHGFLLNPPRVSPNAGTHI